MKLMRWVLMMVLGLALAACGGGGGAGTTSPSTTTLAGVAATGAGVRGIITLKDIPTGQMLATHTDDGRYTFNTSGLAGPFLLRARSDDGATTLYGMVLKTGSSSTGHVNPLTTRTVARLAAGLSGGASTDLAALFNAPGVLASLTAAQLKTASDWTLAHTSPYFQQRLLAHGVAIATLDPATGSFQVGQGLDLAFDEVNFFFDGSKGEAWEQSVATGEVLASLKFLAGNAEPDRLTLVAASNYLVPGSSQNLQATLGGTGVGNLVVSRGLSWELSDPSLASIDTAGIITASNFSGSHTLTVTAHYRNGNLHLQDSVTLALGDYPQLASVDMSRLPATFDSPGSYPLYTTLHLQAGGTLFSFLGQWNLVDPVAATAAGISIVTENGRAYLKAGKQAQDINVRLHAVQSINGASYTSEREVTIKRFVLQPVLLNLRCPPILEYGQPQACDTFTVNSDGSTSAVAASLETDAGAEVLVQGGTLTSQWNNRQQGRSVEVTAHYGELSATVGSYLNPRKTLIESLELLGVTELAEGTTTNYQVWANWNDGSRSNVTSSYAGKFSVSDESLASFSGTYVAGSLLAAYIFDDDSDQDVVVSYAICRQAGFSYDTCPAGQTLSISATVTVRYAPPVITSLLLDTGVLSTNMLAQNHSHLLEARAIWNKTKPGGLVYGTMVGAEAEWESSRPVAVVNGNLLQVGDAGDEPLLMVTARYRDPRSATAFVASKVVTLYRPTQAPMHLSYSFSGSTGLGYTYLLSSDGLARILQVLGTDESSVSNVLEQALPFISNARQIFMPFLSRGYLRDDGTVWYPEPVDGLALPADLKTQLKQQFPSLELPRRIPGLTQVQQVVEINASTWTPGNLVALREDGSIVLVEAKLNAGVMSYTLTPLADIAPASRIAGGAALYALLPDGSVWSRGPASAALGRNVEAANAASLAFGKVLKADGTALSGIVDVTALRNSAWALDSQGVIWSWGNNEGGQLGLGDNRNRIYATPVTSVTGFGALLPNFPAALRSNGSLWRWGAPLASEPQRVADFRDLRYAAGTFAVTADGKVWAWGNTLSFLDVPPQPVLIGNSGSQLVLP